MKRVRYKLVDGYLRSQEMLIGISFGYVVLYPDTLQYQIFANGKPVDGGCETTLSRLKSVAKQALKDSGANFFDEVRNRGATKKL
jgi:hypothetical protein